MKINFKILFILIVIAAILLSGCNAAAAATGSASNVLSSAIRLALGTLKLEGTDQAVTVSQASVLLTLWQAYQSLSNSDTSSQVELEALVKQIQGVMTTEQLKAIDGMNLTDQTVSEMVQSFRDSAGVSAPASTPSATNLSQAGPSGGSGGMPPDGGSISMGDISGEIITQSTPDASQPTASTQPTQGEVILLKALIQLLETRSQASE